MIFLNPEILNFKTLLSIVIIIIVVILLTYQTHLDSFRQQIKKGDIVKFKINRETKKGEIIELFQNSANIIEEGTMKLHHICFSKIFPNKK